MKNQPAPVEPKHQQVASTQFEGHGEIDFTPEPELFDPAELQRDIRAAINGQS